MPPEPVPWDRKDFVFKDRKHERGAGSDALGSGSSSSTPRWREPYHGPRDFPRASPRRPPSGHYRQGGSSHQIYPEESGAHGCTPSRSDRFWLEDESFRHSSGRYGVGGGGGGGGGRSGGGGSRESRNSFRRFPYWDSVDFSRQQHHDPHVTAQRSVAVPIPHASQHPLKDPNDKTGGGVDDGSGTEHRLDQDHSLGSISWKRLKWSRAGSVSSTKAGRSESEETGLEVSLPTGKESPIRSPVTSPAPSDEGAPRKKPRLGWGQGLAKYEKQKVDESLDTSGNATKVAVNDTSPKVVSLAGCPSPATPGSFTCSSSPAGIEEKPCIKAVNGEHETSHCSDSVEEFSTRLGHMEGNPINILNTLLADLLQPEDAGSGDSTLPRQTAMNKLLLLKSGISKELEKTACELDLFENKLKSMDSDAENGPYRSSFTIPANSAPEPCIESSDVASNPSKDHEFSSSACTGNTAQYITSLSEHNTASKDGGVDNPQAGSSRFNDSAYSTGVVYDYHDEKLAQCFEIFEDKFKVPEIQHLILSDVERPAVVCDHGDVNCVEAGSSNENGNSEASLYGKTDYNLITLIMTSNWDAAKKASQVFHKALPTDLPQFDVWEPAKLLAQRKNDLRINEKLAIHKCLLTFKERVLALKFMVLHHLWKEDLRLLSLRKHHSKSSKRFELSCRASQGGYQRQRCSLRTRFALPAGDLTLVPTSEILEFTGKLLSDSQIKLYRNNLKMPALILDEKERKQTKFITHNRLIEDPISFEKERTMINPWTQVEKEAFMEMLATFGKNFTKIASFLDHKTTADCIEFYYKNHKSESFKEVKKQLDLKKQRQCVPTSSYLVTSGKKWNRGINAASLDMLGGAMLVEAHSSGNANSDQRYAGRSIHGNYNGQKVSCGNYRSVERLSSVEIPGHERETVAADVLAGMCSALSSEAMSSCVTSSVDPVEKMNYLAVERPLTPEVTENLDEDTCSNEGCGDLDSFDWTDEEKSMFIEALSMYGKDFARISCCVGTRSKEQCKIFFSKARKCLGLDVIHQGISDVGMPMGDANGGRGDTDDACAAEMDSAICSTQSCSKMDADVSLSTAKINSEGCAHTAMSLHAETDRSSEQGAVGGINLEEEDGKLDEHVSVLPFDKLVSEGDNPLSVMNLKKNADGALRSNEHVQLHEAIECVDAEMKIGGSMVSPVEPVITAWMEVESRSLIDDVVQHRDNDGKFSDDVVKKEVDVPLLMPENGSCNKQQTDTDLINGGKICSASNSKADVNSLLPGKKVVECSRSTFAPDYQHQMPLDLFQYLQKKPQGISLKQENPHLIPLNSVLPDLPSVCFEGPHHVASQATLNFEERGNKHHQNPVARDLCPQYMMRNPSLNQVDEPLHILRGYPLQLINQEVKREVDPLIGEKPVLMESHPKRNGVSRSNEFFMSEVHGDHCKHSNLSHSRRGLLFSMRSEAHPEAQLRHWSQNAWSEPEEQMHRTSDVKLFGQIICHPSSSQKSNSSPHECNSKPSSPGIIRSSTWKPSNAVKAGMPFVSTPRNSGHVGLDELPLRSYGLCDGNRVQTGFSSLPESAVMLAKYHGSLAGMSFYSAKDSVPSRSGILAQQAYMQHLASDGKRIESLCDLPKRNGFEMVSGFQQQGRVARLGASMVGGGILGSGGVSDPVAALKLWSHGGEI